MKRRKKVRPAPEGGAKIEKNAGPQSDDSEASENSASSPAGNKEKIDIKAKAAAAFAAIGAFARACIAKIPERNKKKILGIVGAVLGV